MMSNMKYGKSCWLWLSLSCHEKEWLLSVVIVVALKVNLLSHCLEESSEDDKTLSWLSLQLWLNPSPDSIPWLVSIRSWSMILIAMISIGRRVCISISIGVPLVGIHWHEILHILGLFSPLLSSNASCGRQEDDWGSETERQSNPGKNIRPSYIHLCDSRFLQDFGPCSVTQVILQFVLIVEVNCMPETHGSSCEEGSQQLKDSGRQEVGMRSLPAASDSCEERQEEEEEGSCEGSNHSPWHL